MAGTSFASPGARGWTRFGLVTKSYAPGMWCSRVADRQSEDWANSPYLLCTYTNGIIPRRRLTWDGSAKFTCEPASRTASLLTSRYSVTAAGDQQRPQALCWSVLSAESSWPSLQRRQRWSKTWPKYGAGLDRIWSIRRQRQNSFCNSSAEI